MSQTVAEAAAAYRKRRGEKMARYEAALKRIAARDPVEAMIDPQWFAVIARNALNPETNDG